MTKSNNEDPRKTFDQFELGELLRLGLMLALRDKKKLAAYFLEMALIGLESEEVTIG